MNKPAICYFCFNAYVDAELPRTEDELYFSDELTDDNDSVSHTVGNKTDGFQIFLNSGGGEPVNIELCQWRENGYRGQPGWNTIGIYYPKFCPECGIKLVEYEISDRGSSFKRNEKSRTE